MDEKNNLWDEISILKVDNLVNSKFCLIDTYMQYKNFTVTNKNIDELYLLGWNADDLKPQILNIFNIFEDVLKTGEKLFNEFKPNTKDSFIIGKSDSESIFKDLTRSFGNYISSKIVYNNAKKIEEILMPLLLKYSFSLNTFKERKYGISYDYTPIQPILNTIIRIYSIFEFIKNFKLMVYYYRNSNNSNKSNFNNLNISNILDFLKKNTSRGTYSTNKIKIIEKVLNIHKYSVGISNNLDDINMLKAYSLISDYIYIYERSIDNLYYTTHLFYPIIPNTEIDFKLLPTYNSILGVAWEMLKRYISTTYSGYKINTCLTCGCLFETERYNIYCDKHIPLDKSIDIKKYNNNARKKTDDKKLKLQEKLKSLYINNESKLNKLSDDDNKLLNDYISFTKTKFIKYAKIKDINMLIEKLCLL